jgi:Tol biopolymer transport system component
VKRAHLIAAILFVAGLIVAVVTLLSNQVSIPDGASSGLGIEGRLLLAGQDGVSIFELATGDSRAVFTPEPRGMLTAAALSPDGSTLALAYAPPPDGLIQFGYTNLYTAPLDGSQPPKLLVDGKLRDAIAGPVWAADGKSIVYTRSGPSADGLAAQLSIERIAIAGGEPQALVVDGIAPDLSADGARLAYVAVAVDTAADSLYIANADGSGPAQLAGSDRFVTIDRPHFSPDGRWIVFSGDQAGFAAEARPGVDWVEMLGGVRTASAHNIPTADIWRIPAAGGAPNKLLKLLASGISADYSPDGRHIAFISTQGLYVMAGDGSRAVRIDRGNGFTSVEWMENDSDE